MSCDTKTGHWTNAGDYQISLGATTPSPSTGLAAVVLGEHAGYRVFYKDVSNRLRCLGYVPNGPWGDWGAVSNDETDAVAIAAAFTEWDNMTVVTPKGKGNMEVSQFHKDGLWHIRKLATARPARAPPPASSFRRLTRVAQRRCRAPWATPTRPT